MAILLHKNAVCTQVNSSSADHIVFGLYLHLADDDEAVSTLGKQNGSSQISNQCLVVSVGGVVVKPFVMVFWWSRVSHFGTILSM